ncbi:MULTISPECIES: DUF6681 family protein [Enterococcaceae]|uniref:DUF6681 family protein n=1 Tax=Enterococcaceae TaxID=81852 RepID=UPI000E52E5BA|nr:MULTISPECIES: DUF6681 family protein [Enterococcaceae]MCI0130793.1 hypothetical protein [Vagococcus sp. CY53-2]RGI30181.1 hypothetical protein DXC12_06310 [Melissococcus sp. OM08-11BH]UNM89182.1 hypothetical protein MN187_07760 [Vagococcus sp. CY52-2]
MDAILTLILSNITKFLNYLNINPRLQNKILTVVSVFPTLYILRIVKGYFQNGNYLRMSLYLLIFIVLAYFIVLNFIYYFKNQKVKWDVTNLIENIVPEDATFDETVQTSSTTPKIQGKLLTLTLIDNSDQVIDTVIHNLLDKNYIQAKKLNDYAYELEDYTLIPFYKISKGELFIGSSYKDLTKVATIKINDEADSLIPLGVFVNGGSYEKDGIIYKEPYTLELRVKDNDEHIIPQSSQNKSSKEVSHMSRRKKSQKK